MTTYRFFTATELSCRCCQAEGMNLEFMGKVDAIRDRLGFPFVVTSAYRCPDHNLAVSTTGADGPHTTGRAIDIAVARERAYWVLRLAMEMGLTGIGVSQKGVARRFIHLDDLEDNRPRIWSY